MDIVVLAGGMSAERNVSLSTGESIAAALRRHGHSVVLIDSFLGFDVEKYPIETLFDVEEGLAGEWKNGYMIKKVAVGQACFGSFFGPNVIAACQRADIVFVALHNSDGENGKLQAALDLLGVRYTGNGSMAGALAMDKGISKHFFYYYGVPTPQGFSVKKSGYNRDKTLDQTIFPCVVKPAHDGSSIGASIVKNVEEFDIAVSDAFLHEDEILVEDYIQGREFSIGILDGVALPVAEKIVTNNSDSKNVVGDVEIVCPADLDDEITTQMQLYAERVVAALGLEAYSRMDFILDNEGDIYCLKATTLPGLAETSLLPRVTSAIGLSYSNLCEEIIQISQERFEGVETATSEMPE